MTVDSTEPRLVRIGKIVGCHGIRGEVKLHPHSPEAEWMDVLERVTLRIPGKTPGSVEEKRLDIDDARRHAPHVLVSFDGIETRNQAETLVGAEVYADSSDLEDPGEGEYWADDLIGLTVLDAETGRPRGVVKDLLSSAGGGFLEIKLENEVETIIIPFSDHFFPTVDLAARTVTMKLAGDLLSKPVTLEKLEE